MGISADAIWGLAELLNREIDTRDDVSNAMVSRIDVDGKAWVRLDGSSMDTPVNGGTRVTIAQNDAVLVSIKNGVCTITNNRTHPNATSSDISTVNVSVNQLDEKTMQNFAAVNGVIENLEVDTAKIHSLSGDQLAFTVGVFDNLTAEEFDANKMSALVGFFTTLTVEKEVTAEKISATTGFYDNLTAKEVNADKISSGIGFYDELTAKELNADKISAGVGFYDQLTAKELNADKLAATTGYVDDLVADNVTANKIVAATGYIDDLTTKNITTENISAATAFVGDLYANSITTEDVEAATGYIDQLTTNNVTASNIQAATAFIDDLDAENVTAADIAANKATIAELDSNYAHITHLDANTAVIDNATIDQAKVNNLSVNYAAIDLLNVNNTWIKDGVIDTAAIVDEQVFTVTGNKATISEINAEKISVTNLNAKNLKIETADGYVTIGDKKTPTKEFIDSLVDDIQDKIDSTVETFTSSAVPLTSNYPANQWTTDDERLTHVGDICFVTNSAAAENGFCYRYAYDSTNQTFSWVLIKDNDVTKALGDISTLQTFKSDTESWIEETDSGLRTIRENHTTLSGIVDKTVKASTQLWFTKANTTAPSAPTAQVTTNNASTANAWNLAVPSYNATYPNYFYCWQYQYADNTYGWSAVIRDVAMGESQERARTAITNAAAADTKAGNAQTAADGAQTTANTANTNAATAQSTANANIKSSVQLWYTSNSTTPPAKPTAKVTSTATTANAWTNVVPTYSASTPNYHYCYQQQLGNNNWQWTNPTYDSATSVAMKKAQEALPSSTFSTFQSTTFKELVDEVDEQSSTITKMSESVQYGGRNLLRNTDTGTGWSCDSFDAPTRTFAIGTTRDHEIFIQANSTPYLMLELGEYYTLSCYAKSNGYVSSFEMYCYDQDTKNIKMVRPTITTDWQYFTFTFKYDSWQSGSSPTGFQIRFDNNGTITSGTNAILYVKDAKLERGQYATPWERSQDDITTLSNTVNTVKQTADSNIAKLTNLTTTLGTNADGTTSDTDIVHKTSTIEQDLGKISTRVSTVEAKTSFRLTLQRGAWDSSHWNMDSAVGYRANYANKNIDKNGTQTSTGFDARTLVVGDLVALTGVDTDKGAFHNVVGKVTEVPTTADGNIYLEMIHAEDSIGLADRVKSAETSITQNSDSIALKANAADTYTKQEANAILEVKANKDTLTSEINASADTVTINADRVNIAGATIFTEGRLSESSLNGAYDAKGSAATVQANLNNLQVGGRNYFINTGKPTASTPIKLANTAFGGAARGALTYNDDTVTYTVNNTSGEHYVRFIDAALDNNAIVANGLDTPGKLVFSGEFKASYGNSAAATNVRSQMMTSDTDYWQQITHTNLITGKVDYGGVVIGAGTQSEWTKFAVMIDVGKNVTAFYTSFQEYGPATNGDTISFRRLKLEQGTMATDWTAAPEDIDQNANSREQTVYRSAADGTSSIDATTTWVTASGDTQNSWTTRRPTYDKSYPVLFVAYQRQTVAQSYGTTCSCTTPTIDNTTTVIDGGRIITGSVTANKLNAQNINASNMLTVGSMTNETKSNILNSNVNIGGRNLIANTKSFPANGYVSTETYLGFTVRYNTGSNNGYVDVGSIDSFTVALEPSTEYTLSFYAKASANTTVYSFLYPTYTLSGYNSSGNSTIEGDGRIISNITTSWQRIWVTWKTKSDGVPTSVICARINKNNTNTVYVCGVMLEKGNKASDWSPAPEDIEENAANRTQRIYYRSNVNTKPTTPTAWVTETGNKYNTNATTASGWSTKVTPITSSVESTTKYLYLWTCEQREMIDGTLAYTNVLLDDSTTIIDGGNIITGTVTANQLNATNINGSGMLTIGSLSSDTQSGILNSELTISSTNLIRNGDFTNGTAYWSTDGVTLSVIDDSTYGKCAQVVTTAAGSGGMRLYPNVNTNFTHANGEIYSFSCYAKVDADNQLTVSRVVGEQPYVANAPITTSWKRLTGTITANGTGSLTFLLKNSGTLYLARVMLVHGDKPMDWSPDPRDVSEEFSNRMIKKVITTVSDFNDYKTTGIYYFRVGNSTNAPVGNHGKLTVNFDQGTPNQIFEPDNLNYYYKRIYSSSTWSAWTKVDAVGAQTTADAANNKLVAFRGTCSTAAGTAAKVVACEGFALSQGYSITVYNTTAQTVAGAITLNVNSLGAKAVWVAGAATSDTNRLYWSAGSSVTFVYDGTQFRVSGNPGSYYGTTCSVAETTAAKTTTVNDSVIFKGVAVSVPMSNTNTAASPTLNVSALGACNIYYGTSTTGPTKANGYAWPAGTEIIFIFDGKFWRCGNQTFIDGGNILTGTVAADKLNVNDINAKNSFTIGAFAESTQSSILNSNIAIGGRNRVLSSGKLATSGLPSMRNSQWTTFVEDGITGIKSSVTEASWNEWWYLSNIDPLVEPLNGKQVTYSFEIKASNLSDIADKYCANIGLFSADSPTSTSWSRRYELPQLSFASVSSWHYEIVNNSWVRLYMVYDIPSSWTYTDASTYRYGIMVKHMSSATVEHTLYFRKPKLELGNKVTDWSLAPEDVSADSVKRTQRIYYRSNVNTKPTAMPTAWVTETGNKYNTNATTMAGWSTKVTPITSSVDSETKYAYLWTCEQREMADGTIAYTNVLLDDSTTVIDGGAIVTGSVTANKLNAESINSSKILTVGSFTDNASASILNSNINVGGRNLLIGSSTGVGWSCSTFDKNTYEFTRATTATTESYVTAKKMTLEPNQTYTLSAYIKTNDYVSSVDVWKVHDSGSGSHQNLGYIQATNEYVFYTRTFKCNATTEEQVYIRFDNNGSTASGTNAILYVKQIKLEKGNKATDWTPAPEDVSANAVKRTQRIYYRSNVNTTPSTPSTWVTETGNKYNTNATTTAGWSTKVTPLTSSVDSTTKYIYLWTCEQREMADGTIAYTNVLLDDSMTVIEGGNIATGSITANKLDVNDINAKNLLTIGALSTSTQNSILNSSVQIGSRNLFLNSDNTSKWVRYAPTTYNSAIISMSENLIKGDVYTMQIWGTVGRSDKSGSALFNAFWGGGNVPLLKLTPNADRNYWIGTFTAPNNASTDTNSPMVFIYNTPPNGASGTTYSANISKVKLERGNKATDWSPAPEDVSANSVKRTQRIYYRSNVNTAPTTPSAWVTEVGNKYNTNATTTSGWSTKITPVSSDVDSSSKYIYLWTCEQREMANGTIAYTNVLLDDSLTVIDGGNIATGTITANKLNVNDINAKKSLTIGALSDSTQSSILNSNVSVGGRNLLVGTKDFSSGKGDGTVTSTKYLGFTVCEVTGNSSRSFDIASWNELELEPSTEYTLSFYAKASANTTINSFLYPTYTLSGYNSSGRTTSGEDGVIASDITTSWQRIWVTWKTKSTGAPTRVICARIAKNNTNTVYVCGAMLEKGNKASDWSPSPMDAEAAIATAQSTADGAQTAAASAQTAAGNAQTAADNAQTTANNAQTAAGNAQTAANNAAKTATNYIIYENATDGIKVTYNGTNAATQITSNGLDVLDGAGNSVLYAGLTATGATTSKVRVGRETGTGKVTLNSDGSVDIYNDSGTNLAHFGFDYTVDTYNDYTKSPFYTLGIRKSNADIGAYSFAEGFETTSGNWCSHAEGYKTVATGSYGGHAEGMETTASGPCSHAEGGGSVASGGGAHAEGSGKATASNSHAEGTGTLASGEHGSHSEGWETDATGWSAHAEGRSTTASGLYTHAEGFYATASGDYSHAEGQRTIAQGANQHACGKFNVSDTTSLIIVGNGTRDNQRANELTLSSDGNLWIAGTLTQNSDRRLKTHHAYLGKEASTFMRKLRPALFTKDGERHLGFYAQDVQDAEPENWDTVTVKPDHTDESLDFDPLTLDYTALIAPLTAYAQQLEKRVEYLESTVDSLVESNEELREMVETLIGERI